VRRWRLSETDARAGAALAMARHALLAIVRRAAPRPTLPGRARALVFSAVARGESAAAALHRAAAELDVPPGGLRAQLFADLPGERPMRLPPLHTASFALAVNRALAQGLLSTAESAALALRGAARAVLRTAWLHGSGLEVAAIDGHDVRLCWRADGTARRSRALAAILPVLPWSRQFELRAACRPAGRRLQLVLGSADPILPGAEPRCFDSALEARFASAFIRIAPHWQCLREPAPALVDTELVFPDFELRRGDGEGWLLEIAGLRRADALAGKLRALAALPRLVLCVPRASMPPGFAHARVIPFARRVDAGLVLQRLEELARG
jgi:predicted nuclease of restriction endonuclease-like RecB superfamily